MNLLNLSVFLSVLNCFILVGAQAQSETRAVRGLKPLNPAYDQINVQTPNRPTSNATIWFAANCLRPDSKVNEIKLYLPKIVKSQPSKDQFGIVVPLGATKNTSEALIDEANENANYIPEVKSCVAKGSSEVEAYLNLEDKVAHSEYCKSCSLEKVYYLENHLWMDYSTDALTETKRKAKALTTIPPSDGGHWNCK